jgi:hypothetical protein
MAEDFYSRYSMDYGYEGCIAAMREKEFPNLNGINEFINLSRGGGGGGGVNRFADRQVLV